MSAPMRSVAPQWRRYRSPRTRFCLSAAFLTLTSFLWVCDLALSFSAPVSGSSAAAAAAQPQASPAGAEADTADPADAAAKTETAWPPPHWIRLSTAVGSQADADRVTAAVAEVSQELPVLRARVRAFTPRVAAAGAGGGANPAAVPGETDETEEWLLSLAVPPKATLLVSSMMGEALEEASEAESEASRPVMLLAAGLDFEGEPDYYSGELRLRLRPGSGDTDSQSQSELEVLAREAVGRRMVACAQLDEENGVLYVRTSKTGKEALEAWLGAREGQQGEVADVEVEWGAVGGSGEYLGWVAQETGAVVEEAA